MSAATQTPSRPPSRTVVSCGVWLLLLTACAPASNGSSPSADPTPTSLASSTTSPALGASPSTTRLEFAADPPGTAPVPKIELTLMEDLAYYESGNGATLHLDLYRPESGHGYPLVVLFHANPVFGSTKESVATLATTIAERGAVVAAPTWGRRMPLDDMESIARASVTWYREQGPCAVWRAVDLASFAGADPSRIVLIGEATGVLPAQAATFDPPDHIEGCLSPPADAPIDKAILFETDWLLVPDIWDRVLVDDPSYLATSSYWHRLDQPTSTRIVMLVGETSARETVRSLEGKPYLESEWIRIRDPHGELAEAFAASGTLRDDEMSFTDVTHVVSALLIENGWDAELISVPGVGHALSSRLSRELVADIAHGT